MQNNSSATKPAIVFLAAGISSRFGGKIKQFERVGVNGETLIEVSMQQAARAGFGEIVFVVGEKTEAPFKEKFGDEWRGLAVKYSKQTFSTQERDKPWGTVDALVTIEGVVRSDFIVCNGDDIYGQGAMSVAHDFLVNGNKNECAAVGYDLLSVLPKTGSTNRGIFTLDENGFVKNIDEKIGIALDALKLHGLKGNELVSMNLFALRKEVLPLLKNSLEDFKLHHKGDRKSECYMPVELGALCSSKKISMRLLKSPSKWIGITNPGDEIIVRQALVEQDEQ